MVHSTRGGGPPPPAALAQVWAQLWSDRALVPPERHCVYNAFVGLVLLALAAIALIEPSRRTPLHVIAFGVVGLPLLLGPALAWWRPDTLSRLLALDGILLVGLGLFFEIDSVAWAFRAQAQAPFRYAPGLIVILFLYGAVQLSRPGEESPAMARRRRRLRRVALITGIILELLVVAALLARASRN